MSLFIVIEGIDCSGKKTQSELLAAALGAELFSFPDYSTESGKVLRSYLDKGWGVRNSRNEVCAHIEAFAYQAFQTVNRLEKVPDIEKALKCGHVVADRWTKSGEIYGSAFGLDQKHIQEVQISLPRPDLNILLDIDWETSVKRKPKGRDLYEGLDELMTLVANRYREDWKSHSAAGIMSVEWAMLDGRKPVNELHQEILLLVEARKEYKSTHGC